MLHAITIPVVIAGLVMISLGPFHFGPTDFITYTDPKLGFTIKYPSDWEKLYDNNDTDNMHFYSDKIYRPSIS